jgi:hypothetical protein
MSTTSFVRAWIKRPTRLRFRRAASLFALREYGVLPASLRDLLEDQKHGLAWIKWTRDPWGHAIQFASMGNTIIVTSLGANGKVGGTGADTDLVYRITLKDHGLVESQSDSAGDIGASR